MSAGLLIRRVQLGERRDGELPDVRLRSGRIADIGVGLDRLGEPAIDGRGGALLPGLHDHHLHLLAWAAALESVPCGPPDVRAASELAAQLGTAVPRHGWVRAVGYHESVAGDLDADRLDELRADVPVRVQHRSGALWVVNGAGAAELGLDAADRPGVERDTDGRPTGRLWRLDDWLRDRLPRPEPDLAPVWAELAACGVVGVTDATPELDSKSADLLRRTAAGTARLLLLGAADEPASVPVKIVVADHALPDLEGLVDACRRARPRPVAVHCVTRVALVLCLAALSAAGTVPGDRIEHAAVVPDELRPMMRELGITVVTQPSFVATRGDEYLRDVDPEDHACLWPYASLRAAGIPVAASSDAPYGSPDPWRSIAAAGQRRTPMGHLLGPDERVPAHTALAGWLGAPEDPGGSPRRVAVGAGADLVLLHRPLDEALAEPSRDLVRLTLVGGRPTYGGAEL